MEEGSCFRAFVYLFIKIEGNKVRISLIMQQVCRRMADCRNL